MARKYSFFRENVRTSFTRYVFSELFSFYFFFKDFIPRSTGVEKRYFSIGEREILSPGKERNDTVSFEIVR